MLCRVGIDGGDRVGGFLLTPQGLKCFPASRSGAGMLTSLPERDDYRASDGDHVLSLGNLGNVQRKSHEMAFENRKDRVAQLSRQRSMACVAVSTADKPESVLHPHRKHAGRASVVESMR